MLKAPFKEPNPRRFEQELSFGIATPREFLAKTLILTLDIWHLDPKQAKNKSGFSNPAVSMSYTPKGHVVLIPRCWTSFDDFRELFSILV